MSRLPLAPSTAARAVASRAALGHPGTLDGRPPSWVPAVIPEVLIPCLAADVLSPDSGSLSLQVEKQQFQMETPFHGRGCQRPAFPAGYSGLDGHGAGTGEVPQQLAGGGRTLGRWGVSWVLSITLRSTQEERPTRPGGLHEPEQLSLLLTSRCVAPCTSHREGVWERRAGLRVPFIRTWCQEGHAQMGAAPSSVLGHQFSGFLTSKIKEGQSASRMAGRSPGFSYADWIRISSECLQDCKGREVPTVCQTPCCLLP